MRNHFALPLAVCALGLVACGGDDSDEGAEGGEEAVAVSPAEAIDEISRVRTDIDRALDTYEAGDRAAAAELVGEAYLEHFELVEVPLEEADPELNEELEERIREELTGEMESGAPDAEVEALVSEIDRGLDEAERALRERG